MPGPFDPSFAELPPVIPIFPLAGALLLPGAMLPLNIFEPRYLAMTLDSLKESRIIGMIQPTGETAPDGQPRVYHTGCAGRIVQFAETEDGRILITLSGLARFDCGDELPLKSGYRRVRADYAPYEADFDDSSDDGIDRDRLIAGLKAYLAQNAVEANWQAIEGSGTARLVASLSMMCPFMPSEKQALLEARSVAHRAEILTTLLEMALASGTGGSA